MQQSKKKPRLLWLYAALAIAIIATYWQVLDNEFIAYDDTDYVTENLIVQEGLTLEGVKWAFTTSHVGNWHPLTWLSHMADCQLSDLNPKWHHLHNLLLHVASTLLLFEVLRRMTGAVWRSAFVAAAFALHPMHVESVAWVAERKDVLSGLFWMLTIAAYFHYVQRPGWKRYSMVAVCFILGLMAKPMLVTLPFVLLLLDYWPLYRIKEQWGPASPELPEHRYAVAKYPAIHLFLEKMPLILIAAAISTITFFTQRNFGSMVLSQEAALTPAIRMSNVLAAYPVYIGKLFYPRNLAILYPFPVEGIALWKPVAAAMVLLAVSIFVAIRRRKQAYLVTGWLWFVGTLVPVIGIVQVGHQSIADRYTYIPYTGLLIMISWGIAEAFKKFKLPARILWIGGAVCILAMSVCTVRQLKHWQDSETIYKHGLAVTENNYILRHNLGIVYYDGGRFDESREHILKALEIKPDIKLCHLTLAQIHYKQGQIEKSIKKLQDLLAWTPNWPEPLNYLAWLLATSKEEHLRDPKEAIRLAGWASHLSNNERADILDTLAASYAADGDFAKAVEICSRALELAHRSKDKETRQEIRQHLELFKAKKPFIDR